MPTIALTTTIRAAIETVFDLARSVDVHVASTKQTREEVVAGRTTGLLELGESVTWRARHFGIRQSLTSKITVLERPYLFVDEMVSGAFRSFRHEHHFRIVGRDTEMKDVFVFESPLGPLGRLVDRLVLTTYMTNFLLERNRVLKRVAER